MQTIGPYQLQEELGRGAMGVVFRGFDAAIGRPVAIKIIHAGQFASALESAELKLRFAREAAAAGKLSHPNIVTVYQFGEYGDVQYLVLELVDGESLDKLLSDSQAWDVRPALSILTQVADALDYAHSEGVVHRDVKPANILVRPNGRVKITDFGIARIAADTVTRSGTTFGTPAYMSPEQIMSARVSGQADQFSLGVIAYEMLSGKKPFTADIGPALMHQIMSVEPPPVHTVNPTVSTLTSAVIGKALAKRPEDRFTSCEEFAVRLSESLNTTVGRDQHAVAEAMRAAVGDVPALERKWRWRWSRVAVSIAGGLAIMALAFIVWAKWPRPDRLAQGTLPENSNMGAELTQKKVTATVSRGDTPGTGESKSGGIASRPSEKVEPAPKTKTGVPSLDGKAGKLSAPERKESPALRAPPDKAQEPQVYKGPKQGRIVWTGDLESDQEIDLTAKQADGSVSGALPGVPVSIDVHPTSVKVVTPPGAGNQWRRLVLRNDGKKQVVIVVNWAVIPH